MRIGTRLFALSSVGLLSAAVVLTLVACGSPQTVVCPAASSGCSCGSGSAICLAPGSIYVTASNQILRFSSDPGTGVLTLSASVTTANRLGNVLAPPGTSFVYAAELASGLVGYGASGASLTPVPGSPFSGIDGGGVPSSDGKFLFVPGFSGGNVGVFSIGQDGGLNLLNPVPGVQPSGLPFESAVVFSSPHLLYVSTIVPTNVEILGYSVDSNTGVLQFLPASPIVIAAGAQELGPMVAIGSKFFYVSTVLGGKVVGLSIDTASGALTPVPGSPFTPGVYPSALASDPAGRYLYVANYIDGTVSGFAVGPKGELTPVPGSPFPAGINPVSLVVDNALHLYVADIGSNDISAYSIASSTGSLTPVPGSPFPAGNLPNAIAFSVLP